MDNLLNSLNEYSNVSKLEITSETCCEDYTNHSVSEEKSICRVCGNDINSNISFLPEKCYDNKNQSHHGMPVNELLPDTNLGSVVGGKHYSNYNMRLVQQVNNYSSITYKDRSVLQVFTLIADCCKRHGINDKIVGEAKSIYKHICEKKISRGSNRKGIIAACVFMASKNVGNPRSSKEISKVFDCDSKVITKGIKSVNEILRIHKLGDRVNKERVEYSDLITRFCNNINIEPKQIDEIHLLAKNLLKKYKSELSSCTPSSLSASFIYYYIYLNKLKISKKDLSENTHISIVTIQKIVNLLNDLEIKKNEIY
uniref:Cyclin-like domain-containing protein n=1 Tax=viral metagenome TaxID=1070528 RepID=A0A6C0C6D4_9ZZZZ